MIGIFEKRKDLDTKKGEMTGGEYCSRKCLKLREWDVLTTVFSMLQEVGEPCPQFATEQESPDFWTYWADTSSGPCVEITEALHPDYRRGDFWREAGRPDAPTHYPVEEELDAPWLPLRQAIASKSTKNYPENTWLLIYFNIGRFSFPDWNVVFDEMLLAEHVVSPFEHLDAFGRVLVLSANMESLVELSPVSKSLKTDDWFLRNSSV